MKIAYFINQYPRVSHTFIRREILALERRGFDVLRVALRGWSEEPPDPQDRAERHKTRYLLRDGIAGLLASLLRTGLVSPLRLVRTVLLAMRICARSDRRPLRHLVCVAEACRLVPWLARAGIGHVHAHFGTNSADVVLYARHLGGPRYSLTIHGPEEFESPMGLRDKVRDASFVAAISSYCRSQIYLRCRTVDWPKVHVVRCGLEDAFHSEAGTGSAGSARLVCVGRLCEAKGQLLLIEAAARLRDRGLAFSLVLAGDGPIRGDIEAAIARHRLGDAVSITGWIGSDRVREELLAARALVLPSFAEGLPVVIMEALSLRRPVLSTYVAGIPELVTNGENGWLFPAGSIDALVAAMEDCLSRPVEDIQRMGDAGFRAVVAMHSIDREAAKLAALFEAATT